MNIFATSFPYCVKRLPDGRVLFLNRYYKPLGVSRNAGWIDYDSHHTAFASALPWPQVAKLLGCAESTANELYLYHAGTAPVSEHDRRFRPMNCWRYLPKLFALAQLQPTATLFSK